MIISLQCIRCVKIAPMQERIVFMGSPDFAVPSLKVLVEKFDVMGVVTQPDRPAGRGNSLTPPAVKVAAREYGLNILQPNRLKDEGVIERLQEWNPDAIVVAAFGQILRQNVLELPKFGCINVHASILPRWRGAAPIQAAILAGDALTGVSIMQMDAGIDTGAVFRQREIKIDQMDTAQSLGTRLAEEGAVLLGECLSLIFSGELTANPQDGALATYAPKIEKQMSSLDFSLPAEQLVRMVRAFFPWPGCQVMVEGLLIKIRKAHALTPGSLSPGKRGVYQGFPAIGTSQGDLLLDEIQPAGKNAMPGNVFMNGFRQWESN
jgi:methionyl-tRNA formyltransferase